MQADPQVPSSLLQGIPFPLKQWYDDPPSVLNFNHVPGGDSFLSDPFSNATIGVAVYDSENEYSGSSEAVDDAFTISPMFNPDRSSSFMDAESPLYDPHSPLDVMKAETGLDFSWHRRGAIV